MEHVDAERYWRSDQSPHVDHADPMGLFSFITYLFVDQLNDLNIAGFPLGFYMAAQGSLIAFVVMLFAFASRQDTIDRQEHVAED